MKHLTYLIIFIFFFSCKKDQVNSFSKNEYVANIQEMLEDRMNTSEYSAVDFSRILQSPVKDSFFVRIPYIGKKMEDEFVLLHTDREGNISKGRIISIRRILDNNKIHVFNGTIKIRSLDGSILTESKIVKGFITSFHEPKVLTRETLMANPYVELPEVVVVGYRSDGGNISFSSWMSFLGMFGETGGSGGSGGSGGYYGSFYGTDFGSDGGGESGGGSEHFTGGGASEEKPIVIDFEYHQYKPGIDLQKYLNCFNSIADAGATCTIEIFSDIPVDNDPNKLFNFDTESPGHVFLQVKKSNASQSVVQNIGFYPETNWKTMLTPAPVKGKFVDNGQHEFNASLKMTITSTQLRTALTHMQYLANFVRYDIDEYNCTDLALEVFNYVRHPSNKIAIPKYDIPGGMASAGTSTPQGLYNKLKSMKQSGNSEASNISIPGYKGWVSNSRGACN